MKNIYLLLLCLLPLVAKAQDTYLPFPTDNAEWTVFYEQISSYDPKILHNYHYVPDGDTLINDTVYTRLLRSDGKAFERTTAAYVGAYRNEGSQVVFIAKDSIDAVILYDFSVEPGWILSMVDADTTYYFQLESIDTIILSDQIPRRRYNFYFKSSFDEEPAYYHHSWIEGMGSMVGFFPDPRIFYMQLLPVDPIFAHWLLCFKEKGALLYTNDDYYKGACYREGPISSVGEKISSNSFKIYPNPLTSYVIVEKSDGIFNAGQSIHLVDCYGRIVLQQTDDGAAQQRVDLSDLNAGMYVLEVVDRENKVHYRQKVIKLNQF